MEVYASVALLDPKSYKSCDSIFFSETLGLHLLIKFIWASAEILHAFLIMAISSLLFINLNL